MGKAGDGFLTGLVAVFYLVVDGEVVVVSLGADEAIVDGLFDGAVGFVAVGAVGEMAVVEDAAHFGEEVGKLAKREVDHAELFDAWGVDEEGGPGGGCTGQHEREHLGKGGGVPALHAPLADLAYAEVEPGGDGVEQCRLAHARMAAEEHRLAGDGLADLLDAVALEGADGHDGVAGGLVDGFELVMYFPEGLFVEVALVENDAGGDMVGLGGDEQAVDKAGGGAREAEGGHNAEAVEVGRDDMGLLAEFGSLAHDVVPAVAHLADDAGAVVLQEVFDLVAHGHGVGLLVAPQAIVAPQAAIHQRLPAAGV